MKRLLFVAGALVALPSMVPHRFAPLPGFYIGAGVGAACTSPARHRSADRSASTTVLLADVVAAITSRPRASNSKSASASSPSLPILPNCRGIELHSGNATSCMSWARSSTIFFPASTITPYHRRRRRRRVRLRQTPFLQNTLFAYRASSAGLHIDSQWRVALEGRYVGTTNASVVINGVNVGVNNSNIVAMVYGQYKFAPPMLAAPPAGPAPVAPPSFMVFFDWDSSTLSQASLNVIGQAAYAYKSKGAARIRATGHTDRRVPRPTTWRVAAACERGEECAGPRRRAGRQHRRDRPWRAGPSGQDRRRRARAAEPSRRNRGRIGHKPGLRGRLAAQSRTLTASATN